MKTTVLTLILAAGVLPVAANEVLFEENFDGRLKDGWTWVRENKPAWRIRGGGLEVRIEPGNMWGPANDAKNVLVRDLPDAHGKLELSMTASNQPTDQYEQVDLVAYYDDSHMVKIGFELVDGKRCIVMGREEKDRTRTLAIIPVETSVAHLRLVLEDTRLQGYFRTAETQEWRLAGSCDLPGRGKPRLAIQCYQGPANLEHWARISKVIVRAPQR